MHLKLILMIITGIALLGCETTPQTSGTYMGTGSVSGSGGGGKDSSISSSDLASASQGKRLGLGSQEDLVVNIGDRVFFETDSFQLSQAARRIVEKQAKWIKRYPSVKMSIEGHADERGTREYNLALGERRATAVRDYLIALGINPNRVRTISFGKERPVDARSVPEAWSKNRRSVSIVK